MVDDDHDGIAALVDVVVKSREEPDEDIGII